MLWTFIGLTLLATLIMAIRYSNRSRIVEIDLKPRIPMSEEHGLVKSALDAPEEVIPEAKVFEDSLLNHAEMKGDYNQEIVIHEHTQILSGGTTDKENLGRIDLDQREVVYSEQTFDALRSVAYKEPRSQENRKVVQRLLQKRKMQVKDY